MKSTFHMAVAILGVLLTHSDSLPPWANTVNAVAIAVNIVIAFFFYFTEETPRRRY